MQYNGAVENVSRISDENWRRWCAGWGGGGGGTPLVIVLVTWAAAGVHHNSHSGISEGQLTGCVGGSPGGVCLK